MGKQAMPRGVRPGRAMVEGWRAGMRAGGWAAGRELRMANIPGSSSHGGQGGKCLPWDGRLVRPVPKRLPEWVFQEGLVG